MGSTVQLDDPTPPEQLPCLVHTFVHPLDRFPSSFVTRAGNSGKGVILPVGNEHMHLSSLLGKYFVARERRTFFD